MNFEEHAAKPLLRAAGIAIPRGRPARSADEARSAAAELGGPVVVKAQAPTGKRGKAGGIRTADDAAAAGRAAEAILGMDIAGHRVESVFVEERAAIAAEYYAVVLNDAVSKGPLVMFSPEGGMDVEEVAASMPERLRRAPVDIARGFDLESARAMLGGLDLGAGEASAAEASAARNGGRRRLRRAADYMHDADEVAWRGQPMFGYYAAGRVVATIDRVFPLGAAAEAHRKIEARETRGKLLLKIG